MRKTLSLSLLFILIVVIFLIHSNQVSAREWEIGWPDIPGIVSPSNLPPDQKLTLEYFVTYIFSFALMIVGVVAFLMLIINAIRYMASTAMPGGKATAVEQMRNIGFGVLLMLGAYVLLNTINPELVIFGAKEADYSQVTLPYGTVTLYKNANCDTAGESIVLSYDDDLTDNPTNWNDATTSLMINKDTVVRICHDTDYINCEIFIGDGSCQDAAALGTGFPPGAANGVSSAKVEGLTSGVHLILFDGTNFGGDSRVFTSTNTCTTVGVSTLGNSYWIAQNKNAILCRYANYNECTTALNGPYVEDDSLGIEYQSVCVYDSSPPSCIGVFITNGARDFAPANVYCKDLSTGNATGSVSGVGPSCKVNVCDSTNCTGTCQSWPNPPGDWDGTLNGVSAGALAF